MKTTPRVEKKDLLKYRLLGCPSWVQKDLLKYRLLGCPSWVQGAAAWLEWIGGFIGGTTL
jgi:hypothetical protein